MKTPIPETAARRIGDERPRAIIGGMKAFVHALLLLPEGARPTGEVLDAAMLAMAEAAERVSRHGRTITGIVE